VEKDSIEWDTHLIFGGSGFIGTHLAHFLKESFKDIIPVNLDLVKSKNVNAEYHKVDVRKPIQYPIKNGQSTIIYNLAAVHRTPGHPDKDYFEANIYGAEHICRYATENNIRTIVFTSSIAPYGAAEELKKEESLPMPNTPYGISKLVAEKIHMAWARQHPDNRLVIVRPGVVFGKGEYGNFSRLYKALKRGVFAYAGRRDTIKAAIYVKDLVRVMVEMARNKDVKEQLYNCTLEPAPSIENIVESVHRIIGVQRKVFTLPANFLRLGACGLGWAGFLGFGFHPDRVRKLMVSTRISGEKLQKDYPLKYSLEAALNDWWQECEEKGLY
jgi:GlcNAc-P-P-Und epimerase